MRRVTDLRFDFDSSNVIFDTDFVFVCHTPLIFVLSDQSGMRDLRITKYSNQDLWSNIRKFLQEISKQNMDRAVLLLQVIFVSLIIKMALF